MSVKLEALKLLARACEDFLLTTMPELVSEEEAFKLAKAFSSKSLANEIIKLVGEVEPEKLVKAYFNLFEIVEKPYSYKIKSKRPLVLEIKDCPQRPKLRGRNSCVACLGLVAGVLERAFGSVRVEAFGKSFGPEEAAVVLKKEGEPGNCLWKVEARSPQPAR